jgi:hypothetical protein
LRVAIYELQLDLKEARKFSRLWLRVEKPLEVHFFNKFFISQLLSNLFGYERWKLFFSLDIHRNFFDISREISRSFYEFFNLMKQLAKNLREEMICGLTLSTALSDPDRFNFSILSKKIPTRNWFFLFLQARFTELWAIYIHCIDLLLGLPKLK